MGYPMTFRRIVARNGLSQGDYDDAAEHRSGVNTRPVGDTDSALPVIAEVRADAIAKHEAAWKSLLGDLRRFERDAVDEQAIAQRVAQATGVDIDDVAAVIAAFMSY